MSARTPPMCDEIQMAVLARLDSEAPLFTPADIDVHVASCSTCRAAVEDIATLHAQLNCLVQDQLDVNLWPMVRSRLTVTSPHLLGRERGAIIGLAVALGTWRLAQLLLDLPAPVINSVVPLVLIVLVLWRFTGDPFAIRVTPLQLEEEGGS